MGPISAEIEVDVSARGGLRACSTTSPIRPSFTDHFLTDFHLTRIDAVGVGAGGRFRVNAPLRSPWKDTTIVELEASFRIVERGLGGRTNRIPDHTVWELTSGTGSLTEVRFTHWTEPNHLDRAIESLSWRPSGRSGAGSRRCAGCATTSRANAARTSGSRWPAATVTRPASLIRRPNRLPAADVVLPRRLLLSLFAALALAALAVGCLRLRLREP